MTNPNEPTYTGGPVPPAQPHPPLPPPGQPAPQPPRKRGLPGWAIALLAVAGGLVLLCGIGIVAVAALDDGEQTAIEPRDDRSSGQPTAEPVDDEPEEEPDEEPEPEDTVGQIGDTATISEFGSDVGTITVTKVETSTAPADNFGDGPKHGHFVIFTVEMEATGGSMAVCSCDFYVLDDGERIDEMNGNAIWAIDYDDGVGFAELNSGERRSGLLAFDMGKPVGELAFDPDYFADEPAVVWEFDER